MSNLVTNCRTCHAEIVWFETYAGKRMPVDYNEQVLEDRENGEYFDPKADHHISHFATCKNANMHRKSSGKKDTFQKAAIDDLAVFVYRGSQGCCVGIVANVDEAGLVKGAVTLSGEVIPMDKVSEIRVGSLKKYNFDMGSVREKCAGKKYPTLNAATIVLRGLAV